ncbi:transcriptional regulator NrdR [Candidatus Woesearchaeota archaeon]|nr:transcriptional regulator NrdR [Candidatus Woesearchaeota archaeon]
MYCIYCNHSKTKVVDKRTNEEATRRRRECLKCKKRFTTYEKPESIQLTVVKKDGRREDYNREKLTIGIKKACEKRPVSTDKITRIIDEIESKVKERKSKEIPTSFIGEMVVRKLKTLDKVAYVRFASVYKSFDDIKEFEKEVKALKR